MLMELFSYGFGASVHLTLVLPHIFSSSYNSSFLVDPFFFFSFFN